MKIKQFDIWLADLNPPSGTEPGKVRPVLIVQTDLLNKIHLSTLICPITTNVILEAEVLRVHLQKGMSKLTEDSDVLIDQVRAVDNKRLIKRLGAIPGELHDLVRNNLRAVLDL
jgi:mRNA interferase MazF